LEENGGVASGGCGDAGKISELKNRLGEKSTLVREWGSRGELARSLP